MDNALLCCVSKDIPSLLRKVDLTDEIIRLARTPREIPGGVSREQYAEVLTKVVMAMFGISHTANTRTGNDFVRGVSGGEFTPPFSLANIHSIINCRRGFQSLR